MMNIKESSKTTAQYTANQQHREAGVGGRSARQGVRHLLAVALLALTGWAPGAAANNYYVATNGNDGWTGTASVYMGGNVGPFANLHPAARAMQPGDTTYVRGGFYNCTNTTRQYFDPQASNVTLTNYPGETNMFANQMAFGPLQMLIYISGLSNIQIYGINATNCQRTAEFYSVTNCTLAYCNFGFASTNYTMNGMVYFGANSVSNIIHDNVFHDNQHDNVSATQIDAGTTLLLGTLEANPNDATGYNVVTNNLLYHGGHDVIQIQSSFNIIRNNTMHNEPWVWWGSVGQLGGQRCVDVEPRSQGNVIDGNWVTYAGLAIANPSGNGMEICGASNIVRMNAVLWSQEYGILLYGNKDHPTNGVATNAFCTANHVFNNTLAFNSLGQQYTTNATTKMVMDYTGNKSVIGMNYGTNNTFLNNLLHGNGSNWWYKLPANNIYFYSGSIADNHWGAQWTNTTNGDPLFYYITTNYTTLITNKVSVVSPYQVTGLGSPWDAPFTSFNLRLQSNSPCLGTGQFLTTITSPSGTGTTFTVGDAQFFTDGFGMVPGDTIQFQGTGQTAVIQQVLWNSSTIILTSPVTWTQGQGIALPFAGNAPNFGAFGVGP